MKKEPPRPASDYSYVVEAGTFKNQDEADQLVKELRVKGFKAIVKLNKR